MQKSPLGRARLACERISLGRFRGHHSAVVHNCLLDTWCGFLQVVKVQGRMELDVGIEGQKPRLRNGWDLSRIPQVKERR